MEYGVSAHWSVQLAAFYILLSISMVSSGNSGAGALRRLGAQAVSYAVSITPVAALVYILYVVSGRL